MSTDSLRSQGTHGSGRRDFDPRQYRRVVDMITAMDNETLTVEDVSRETGVPGRAVREIVSQADGVEFLLGGDGNGYRLATDAADAARLTQRFLSQAGKMHERAGRRSKYAATLPSGDRQEALL
jgi:hypothetical protein